jgi:hypothetical protein
MTHIRDPQFYALPAATRGANGNRRVMGFPPIGIMVLSAVLKRAGHECVMFDQANPDTPNESHHRRDPAKPTGRTAVLSARDLHQGARPRLAQAGQGHGVVRPRTERRGDV